MPNIEVIDARVADAFLEGPPTETIWCSPLEICFSQNVIYPRFTDGKSVDDAVKQIQVVSDRRVISDDVPQDEDYLVMETPFPTMEAVRWSPKLRDGQGRPLLDEHGDQRRGSQGLFSVDNRRLYALQRAAVAHYPRRCLVEVAISTDKNEVMKHLKKFRTRTNGLSITVSEWNGVGRDNARHYSAMRVWDWRSAVARAREEGATGDAAALLAEAASSGSCGCWEYLDNSGIHRGPFSNWQMRQWWEHGMLPGSLKVRPYDAATTAAGRGPEGGTEGDGFVPVLELFAKAPAPFAAGWSPRATDQEAEWKKCGQCGRKRWEGWSANNDEWFCANCWKRWESKVERMQGPAMQNETS